MGVATNLIPALLDAVRAHNLHGSVLMLGRQDIVCTREHLRRIFDWEKFKPGLQPDAWLEEDGHVTPESFFQALWFAWAESLDISDSEGASVIFDLNEAETPAEQIGRFDLVLDGGTLEHVFHIPNAMAHCARMIRPGGSFMHIGPMNNYVDHGFYQFSPTLWFDWFGANGWQIAESVMVRLPPDSLPDETGWSYSFLPPERLGTVGALDDAPYMHLLVAKKIGGAGWDRVPQQAYYARKHWDFGRQAHGLREIAPYRVVDGRRVDDITGAKAE